MRNDDLVNVSIFWDRERKVLFTLSVEVYGPARTQVSLGSMGGVYLLCYYLPLPTRPGQVDFDVRWIEGPTFSVKEQEHCVLEHGDEVA